MPDPLTHISLGYIIARFMAAKKKSLVLLGSGLPDIAYVIFSIAYLVFGFSASRAILVLHTPVGAILLAAFTACFFRYSFKRAFGYIGIGVISHFVLDGLMFPAHGSVHFKMLWPFSFENYGIAIGSAFLYLQITIIATAVFLFLADLIKAWKSKKRKKMSRSTTGK